MKVSVSIVAYNHEKFIAKTLDSVLMQRTTFDYEIVIGEDCSTDTTRAILMEYQDRYPGVFRLLLNERNLGAHKNIENTMQACRGEYVALLDGDDYWTSPGKLQKQVDFLDNHPECPACFHDALIVHADGSREPTPYRPGQKAFSTVEDLLLDNFIPTSAVMFRRYLLESLPAWIGRLKMGDWPFHILSALQGKIGYIDETMSVYVVHHGGAWSAKGWQDHAPAIIELFEALRIHLDRNYAGIINSILRWRYYSASEQYENGGDPAKARTYLGKSIGKYLSTFGYSPKYAPGAGTDYINSLPDTIRSVNGRLLFRGIVRLYVMPVLKPRFPMLYRLLRAGFYKTIEAFSPRPVRPRERD